MMKKICFVIMGFHKKTDYVTGKTYDLDKTYHNMIKPTVEKLNYICIRADEVVHTGYIDKYMYQLLVHADLVIADLTTLNPNALYELGIRHASRPFRTIVIGDKSISGIRHPFDLNHISTFYYEHLGADIGVSEAKRFSKVLEEVISKTEDELKDSPLYDFVKDIKPHNLSKHENDELIELLMKEESEIQKLLNNASRCMKEKRFNEAYNNWKLLNDKNPKEILYIQKMALCKYKSSKPYIREELEEAKTIIETISYNHNDPETMGITGAVYKNIYLVSGDVYNLKKAVDYYNKGYTLSMNYYNGENYATCCEMMELCTEGDEKTHYLFESKSTRDEVFTLAKRHLENELGLESFDHWSYASLSNYYYYLGDKKNYKKYMELFLKDADEWMINTFNQGIHHIDEYKKNKEE